jgi:hypothetical protein
MLMLFSVQVMQTNKNESNWRKKKKQLSTANKQKNVDLLRKQKILIKKI